MLYILFSFDYELFLGKNFVSFDEILFEPTYKIADIFEKNNCTATFFADTLSSLVLNKFNNYKNYSTNFDKQLKYLISHSFDVQLHIHSNWVNSYVDKELVISNDKSKIHEFGFGNSGEAESIISDSVKYLCDICSSIDNKYICVAYRAGGFLIQPEKELVTCLKNVGISIDSSFAPHMKNINRLSLFHSYDFRKYPSHSSNVFIGGQKQFEYFSSNCNIFEIPILTFKPDYFYFLLKGKKNISLSPIKVNGSYISFSNASQKKHSKCKSLLNKLFGYRIASLDSYNAEYLFFEIKRFYRKNNCEKKDYFISIIGHPKLLYSNDRLNNIDYLLNKLCNSGLKISTINFQQAYQILKQSKVI